MQLYYPLASQPIMGLNFTTLCEDDVQCVLAMRNDKRVASFMYAQSISLEAHREFIDSLKDNPRSKYWLFKCGGVVLGVGSLSKISLHNAHAYIGIYTNPFLSKQQRQMLCEGSAFASVGEMILAALEQASRELGLHALYLEVLESNAHARAFYERRGFALQGRLREFIRANAPASPNELTQSFADVCVYGKVLESTFAKKDSACGLESRISARVRRLHTPSMRPCTRLKNHDSSSTILESQSSSESHKSCREQVEPERSPTSNTANPRILEKRKRAGREKSAQSLESTFSKVDSRGGDLSLRDTAEAVAWQSNSAPAESNQINGARKACNLESVQGDWGVKGGIRGDASQVAPLSPLEKNSSKVSLKSSNNAQRVDSSVDCHASTTALARNDEKNATFKKVDSRENAKNVSKQPKDSRICKNAQNVSDSQAAGFSKETSANAERYPLFCDDFLKKPAAAAPCTAIAGFVGCRAQSKGAYLAYVTAALRDDSRKSAQKPTPKPNQAESSSPQPLLVAEISANHNQSLRLAQHTIKAAAIAGADFIKLQTYTPECLTIVCDKPRFRIDSGTLWDGESLYDLYQKACTPFAWHKELFDYARGLGVGIFSSPFSAKALELLESLECPMYKIASFEITDIPFIKLVASTKKPIIISTGIATHQEILEALQACYDAGNDDITLLLCTSSYPAPLESAHIASMPTLARYGVKYGLSDHTQGDLCALLACALGASMIEKHFIIRRSLGGVDAEFSMEAREFAAMAQRLRAAHLALGSYDLDSKLESNAISSGRAFARSLFVCEDVKKGQILTPSNIRSIRPSGGLSPKFLPEVLGKRAARDLEKGSPLSWQDFS